MSLITYAALLGAVASTAYGHGHVASFKTGSTTTPGGFIKYNSGATSNVVTPGWTTEQIDNGFTAPSSTNGDVICAKSATSGGTDLAVAAGSNVDFVWNTWPESHHGPVINYLAKCPGNTCVGVDKSTLKFFKISEAGLSADSVGKQGPGKWASDDLMANGLTGSVTIPKELPDGAYVARHEIIALHSAGTVDGAQLYPQCVNLKVTGGSGTMSTDGVVGTSLYDKNDPGLVFNLYTTLTGYKIPGPALRTGSGGSSPAPAPSSSAAPAPSSSAAASSSAAPAPTSSAAATSVSAPVATYTAPAETTVVAVTTTAAASTYAPAPTGSSGSGSGSTKPIPEGVTLDDLLAWLKVILNRTSPTKRSEFFSKMLM